MNEQRETFEETWNRVEVALGGRFRDGIECPSSIVDLYRLALADAEGACELEDGERLVLKEHLHVCPVCRHTYLGALSGAKSELQINDEDDTAGAIQEDLSQSFGDEANTTGSLLDEFASAGADVRPAQKLPLMRFQCDGITGGVLKSAADAEMQEKTYSGLLPLDPEGTECQRSFRLLVDPSKQAGRVWIRATVESEDVAAELTGWQLQMQTPDAKKVWRFTSDEAGDLRPEDDESGRTACEMPQAVYEIQLQSPQGEQWRTVVRLDQSLQQAANATNVEPSDDQGHAQ